MAKLPRVYGTADPDSDQPPTTEGLRGERADARSPVVPPHSFIGADGQPIAVEEASGSAGAASTGVPADADDAS